MKELLGVKLTDEEFDFFLCEQGKGKQLKVVEGKIVAEFYQLTEEEQINALRMKRKEECFSFINRGKLWYDSLTNGQVQELEKWYKEWLDVTETKIIPNKLEWLK